ncbi:MAG TPA: cell division protein ZapA [Rhizomicrobium sp.]
MPLVNVMVNARAYTIACDDGEEDHLRELAAHVDEKVRELLASVGQVGETRLLLMAALLIADEHHDAATQLHLRRQELAALAGQHDAVSATLDKAEAVSSDAFEAAAKRLEELGAKLGHG